MNFLKQIFLPIAIVVLSVFLLFAAYNDVKRETINQLNVEQLTHAKQAAKGIQIFFSEYENLLNYLAAQNSVIELDENGKQIINNFFYSHAFTLKAITRIDDKGKIIYTVPNNSKFVGQNISYQEHVQRILETHKKTVSDVFETVQGYRSIAYYVPVFKNGVFKGGLAVLVPFDSLAKYYLKNIRVRKSGFAYTVSQKGIMIYTPLEKHNYKNVFNIFSNSPSAIAMLKKAIKGESGTTFYELSNQEGVSNKFCAVYFPVKIADRYWSIIVSTPESEILSTMKGFITKWVVIVFLLTLGTSVYLYYILKAKAIVKEELKRKKAEEALIQSEQKFKTLFQTAGDAIFLVELDGRIIEVNNSASEKFGYSREEFLQMTTMELNLPGNEDKVLERVETMKKKGELYFETVYLSKGGEQIPVEVSGKLIDYENRKITLGIVRDISLRKKQESELIKSKEEAEKANRLKSEFLAQISHEIRSPLNVILGFSELIRDELKENLTQKTTNSFKAIDTAGRRIIRTVELILNMSELHVGTYEPSPKRFDLVKDLLKNIFKEYEFSAIKKGLEFKILV
ncbi:MAG: PAS domain S-box protein, partial [Bacteroidota bacterium]